MQPMDFRASIISTLYYIGESFSGIHTLGKNKQLCPYGPPCMTARVLYMLCFQVRGT